MKCGVQFLSVVVALMSMMSMVHATAFVSETTFVSNGFYTEPTGPLVDGVATILFVGEDGGWVDSYASDLDLIQYYEATVGIPDESGNGTLMTIYGDCFYDTTNSAWRVGMGEADYINVSYSTNITPQETDFTVGLWYDFIEDIANVANILSWNDSYSTDKMYLHPNDITGTQWADIMEITTNSTVFDVGSTSLKTTYGIVRLSTFVRSGLTNISMYRNLNHAQTRNNFPSGNFDPCDGAYSVRMGRSRRLSGRYGNSRVHALTMWKRGLSDGERTNYYDAGQSISTGDIPSGVSLHLDLSKSYILSAFDSLNGYHGTMIPTVWDGAGQQIVCGTNPVDLTLIHCIDFDEVDDAIVCTNNFATNMGTGFTAEMWIRPRDLWDTQTLVANYDGTNGFECQVGNSDSNLQVTIYDDGSGNFISAETTSDPISSSGTWYHVAFAWDGTFSESNLTIFVDGADEAVSYSSGGTVDSWNGSSVDPNIGRRPAGAGSQYYNGQLNDFIVAFTNLPQFAISDRYTNTPPTASREERQGE